MNLLIIIIVGYLAYKLLKGVVSFGVKYTEANNAHPEWDITLQKVAEEGRSKHEVWAKNHPFLRRLYKYDKYKYMNKIRREKGSLL